MERRLKVISPKALVKKFLVYPYGESDIIVVDGNLVSQYEIKRTDHEKARDRANAQLFRGEGYWSNGGENLVDSFYVVSRGEWFYEVNKVISFNPMTFFKKNRYYLRGDSE